MFEKKDKDEILEKFISGYSKYFNNKYEQFTCVYSNIKTMYEELINKNKINIKIERYRLENKKVAIESNTNAYGIAFIVLSVTIAVTFLMDILKEEKWAEFLSIIAYFIFLIYWAYIKSDNPRKQIIIYDIAVKALNDIEKENAKDLAKEEIATTIENNHKNKIEKSYEETIQYMTELVKKQYYYISFIVKNGNTGNMKEWTIVNCEVKDLENEINNYMSELKKKYQEVQADTVTKL